MRSNWSMKPPNIPGIALPACMGTPVWTLAPGMATMGAAVTAMGAGAAPTVIIGAAGTPIGAATIIGAALATLAPTCAYGMLEYCTELCIGAAICMEAPGAAIAAAMAPFRARGAWSSKSAALAGDAAATSVYRMALPE
mmetsp:Transcript_52755/g.84241  ORF Transcript_52755/g.84241 Transcript_52755/m.84241 type:complete len:139 (-) Transcript_52755:3275-3691(-)